MLSVAVAVIAAIVAKAHADNGAPIVQTSFGPIKGRSYGGVEEYMGIPFATAERWADPVDWTEKWSHPRPAVKPMPGCGQDSKKPWGPGWSEDCLYLNVWKPAGVNDSLPVLFFIYGGAFITGEASGYNCSVLAKKHNAVYVTANYRVGALGWLAVNFSANFTNFSANFGLKDQQSALRWANKEAVAFGGDRSRLMIFGESAGGISVVSHILSPQSDGLFTRALSESGNSAGTKIEVAAYQTYYFNKKLGCALGDLVCMRKVSLEQIQAAQDYVDPPTCPIGVCQGWGPVIDGLTVPADPTFLLQNGKFNRNVSALLGTNTNEGSAFAYGAVKAPYGPAEFRDYVISVLGHGHPVMEKVVEKVLKRYPPFHSKQEGDNRVLAGDFFGDLGFVCPSRHVLRLLSTFSTKPMYRYRYNHLSYCEAGSPRGVSHGEEVPYVFDAGDWECPKFTPAEEHFSEDIGAAWRQFADTGTLTAGWGKFSNSTDAGAILVPKTSGSAWNMEQKWRADFCEFWDHFCDNHFCDHNNLTTTFKFSSKYLWQRARTHGPSPDADVTIVV